MLSFTLRSIVFSLVPCDLDPGQWTPASVTASLRMFALPRGSKIQPTRGVAAADGSEAGLNGDRNPSARTIDAAKKYVVSNWKCSHSGASGGASEREMRRDSRGDPRVSANPGSGSVW